MGYSPWGCKDSDTTERLHFTMDREAWWAVVRGVTGSDMTE